MIPAICEAEAMRAVMFTAEQPVWPRPEVIDFASDDDPIESVTKTKSDGSAIDQSRMFAQINLTRVSGSSGRGVCEQDRRVFDRGQVLHVDAEAATK